MAYPLSELSCVEYRGYIDQLKELTYFGRTWNLYLPVQFSCCNLSSYLKENEVYILEKSWVCSSNDTLSEINISIKEIATVQSLIMLIIIKKEGKAGRYIIAPNYHFFPLSLCLKQTGNNRKKKSCYFYRPTVIKDEFLGVSEIRLVRHFVTRQNCVRSALN